VHDYDDYHPVTETRIEATPHGLVRIDTTYLDDASACVVIWIDGVETERMFFNEDREAKGFAAREFACLHDTRSLEEKLDPNDPLNN
jgi:hypothetical protein